MKPDLAHDLRRPSAPSERAAKLVFSLCAVAVGIRPSILSLWQLTPLFIVLFGVRVLLAGPFLWLDLLLFYLFLFDLG